MEALLPAIELSRLASPGLSYLGHRFAVGLPLSVCGGGSLLSGDYRPQAFASRDPGARVLIYIRTRPRETIIPEAMYMKRKDKIPRPIEPSPLDPQGSYTGVPMDPRERPVQDADDL